MKKLGYVVLALLVVGAPLYESEPKLMQVPGHDAAAIDALVGLGFLKPGFVVP